MRFLILKANTPSPEPKEESLSRVDAYLTARGYRRMSTDRATYTRGSTWGSFTGFTPRVWAATATIECDEQTSPATYRTVFEVNVSGQMITDPEREFWHLERDGVAAAIQGVLPAETTAAEAELALITKRFCKQAGMGIGSMILGGLLLIALLTAHVRFPRAVIPLVIALPGGIGVGLATRHLHGTKPKE